MQYVIVEFVADIAPQVVNADLPLTCIADCLGIDLRDLIEQTGPTISATSVWNARTEEIVAMYQDLPSLREFM